MKLKQLHYVSSFFISLFIFSHLLNHLISFFSFESHISMMTTLRLWYRNPIVEPILIGLLGFQIYSGIKLLKNNKNEQSFFNRLQKNSGLYLSLFLCIHLGAVFVGRYILLLNTNIYFGIAGLNSFPHLLFFIPYYSLAILAFFPI